jgi:hypothetical protein
MLEGRGYRTLAWLFAAGVGLAVLVMGAAWSADDCYQTCAQSCLAQWWGCRAVCVSVGNFCGPTGTDPCIACYDNCDSAGAACYVSCNGLPQCVAGGSSPIPAPIFKRLMLTGDGGS